MEAAEKQSELKMPLEQELDQNSGEMNDMTEVEKKVLSKFDKFVMPQMALLVLFAYLDRTNIGKYLATLGLQLRKLIMIL
ncbi:hypothetical protein FOC4_g10001793 [Fusarium odoratissimum]|uniref:Major facilitator superfamily (MFS) profile domain-containing protein n=2 Tax=Fusarium oxysporum species complex TaxID=171631 RepID=N1S0D7_FUSC4|nr:hypothetical protein FOC4_g10001793 [Fusarium odoratissimum]TXC10599.1 hypothetical protein FocTR4_00005983 [Fusarium oxysporum f. sp. cubense]